MAETPAHLKDQGAKTLRRARSSEFWMVDLVFHGALLGFFVISGSLSSCGGADSAHGPRGDDDTECTPVVLDGGGGIPAPPNGGSSCAEGTCNYQTQAGCPTHLACRPQFPAGSSEVTPGCEAAGTGRAGEACENSSACARGNFCVGGTCRKMCCGGDWSACDAGESCIRQFFVAFGARREHAVDLCFPVGTCDLFDPQSCADESTDIPRECKIVDPTGAVACAPASTRGFGDPCSPPDVCAQGLTCVGERCVRLCKTEVCAEPGCLADEGPCVHFDRDPEGVGECAPGW